MYPVVPVVPPGMTSSGGGGPIPVTGAPIAALLTLALGLILVGLLMRRSARRRAAMAFASGRPSHPGARHDDQLAGGDPRA